MKYFLELITKQASSCKQSLSTLPPTPPKCFVAALGNYNISQTKFLPQKLAFNSESNSNIN